MDFFVIFIKKDSIPTAISASVHTVKPSVHTVKPLGISVNCLSNYQFTSVLSQESFLKYFLRKF